MDPKSSKMTVKEFKAQIKERILAEMTDDLDEMHMLFKLEDKIQLHIPCMVIVVLDLAPQPHKVGNFNC